MRTTTGLGKNRNPVGKLDEKAFLPDKDGKVDMSGYNYEAKKPELNDDGEAEFSYVNFDYGLYAPKQIHGFTQTTENPG